MPVEMFNNEEKKKGLTIAIIICGFIGYTDSLNDRWQNGQLLAGEIVPYEPGSGKWKYFTMGFSEGYDDGHSAGEANKK